MHVLNVFDVNGIEIKDLEDPKILQKTHRRKKFFIQKLLKKEIEILRFSCYWIIVDDFGFDRFLTGCLEHSENHKKILRRKKFFKKILLLFLAIDKLLTILVLTLFSSWAGNIDKMTKKCCGGKSFFLEKFFCFFLKICVLMTSFQNIFLSSCMCWRCLVWLIFGGSDEKVCKMRKNIPKKKCLNPTFFYDFSFFIQFASFQLFWYW